MRLVSRIEEIILLSIWRLDHAAYGIAILEEVRKATGKAWLTGSIYACLARLLKHDDVMHLLGEFDRLPVGNILKEVHIGIG